MVQDLMVQSPKFRAWIDAQIFAEPITRRLVCLESGGLVAGPVPGKHELGSCDLAGRIPAD
ncbi:MAG: hypothetical protein WAU75_13920 [Solirubrobacteraceae bacterium]